MIVNFKGSYIFLRNIFIFAVANNFFKTETIKYKFKFNLSLILILKPNLSENFPWQLYNLQFLFKNIKKNNYLRILLNFFTPFNFKYNNIVVILILVFLLSVKTPSIFIKS